MITINDEGVKIENTILLISDAPGIYLNKKTDKYKVRIIGNMIINIGGSTLREKIKNKWKAIKFIIKF